MSLISKADLKQFTSHIPFSKIHQRQGKIYHLRISSNISIENILINLPVSISSINSTIASGSFDTFMITLNESFNNIARGSYFYLVNTLLKKGKPQKITKKLLTPSNLSLDNTWLSINEIIDKASDKINQISFLNNNEKQYLISILHGKYEPTCIFSLSDLNIIAQDFGEILGAIWFYQNNNGSKIRFPYGNQMLYDSEVLIDNEIAKISSKVGQGGPSSIKSIALVLEEKPQLFQHLDKNKINIIKLIAHESTVTGILKAVSLIKDNSIDTIEKQFCKLSATDIEHFLKDMSVSQLISFSNHIKDLIGRKASDKKIQEIVQSDSKRNGILISPLGYYLVDLLNKDQEFSKILQIAAKNIDIFQIYTTLTLNTLSMNVYKFENCNFRWEYNSNAGNPSLKKISFRMIS